ncbi:MAG: ABC transporter ATP-binding protein [Deltaproteobacteria bacterium]|nr:ABC transporter ATP-binding protein [Deltaproteobacteria bacterium]
MPVVEVRNACFSYGTRSIFEQVSFTVDSGEIFCLLGPNGSGKTTLLDCILGFHRLGSGTISIMEKETKDCRPGQVARSLAYVPQNHERTFPYTVREIVTMGRAAHLGLFESPSDKDRLLAEGALERIGIRHLGDRPYTQISSGETQLVMIARAIVQQAPVIILDEPTAHLDFRYEMVIMEIITGLVKINGLTVIMATHFPNHSFYFQNKGIRTATALLHQGKFMAMGPPESVLDEDSLKKLYGVNVRVISLNNDGSGTMQHIVPLSTANQECWCGNVIRERYGS